MVNQRCVNKGTLRYMGRVYRAPENFCEGDEIEVWVNFGWNNEYQDGVGQCFPDYEPTVMANWMSKERYDAMTTEILTYFEENGCYCCTKGYERENHCYRIACLMSVFLLFIPW